MLEAQPSLTWEQVRLSVSGLLEEELLSPFLFLPFALFSPK